VTFYEILCASKSYLFKKR